MIQLSVNVKEYDALAKAYADLGRKGAKIAISQALNKVGAKAKTQSKRVLAAQTSYKVGYVASITTEVKSGPATLTHRLKMVDTAHNIGILGAKQTKAGVVVTAWGKKQLYEGTFIIKKWGGVYKRKGERRFPLKSIYAPVLPNELVRNDAHGKHAKAFTKLANDTLADQILKQVAYQLGLAKGK